jgi:hypothetical protein
VLCGGPAAHDNRRRVQLGERDLEQLGGRHDCPAVHVPRGQRPCLKAAVRDGEQMLSDQRGTRAPVHIGGQVNEQLADIRREAGVWSNSKGCVGALKPTSVVFRDIPEVAHWLRAEHERCLRDLWHFVVPIIAQNRRPARARRSNLDPEDRQVAWRIEQQDP